jgi:hypothetical protein
MDTKIIARGTVEWILLAQHRIQWQALVNTVMNSVFLKRRVIS